MKKEDLLDIVTFVRSEIFEQILNGEINKILRVLYPSNREVFIISEDKDSDSLELIPYNAMRIIDISGEQEMLLKIINVEHIFLDDTKGNVFPYIIRGKEYRPEGLVFEVGNVINIEEDGTDI